MSYLKSPTQRVISRAETDLALIVGHPVKIEYKLIPIEQMAPEKALEVKLKKIIIEEAGIKNGDIEGDRRPREIVMARQLFCFFYKSLQVSPKAALKDICQMVGGRDHTTVIHAIQQVRDLLEIKDDQMTTLYNKIKNRLHEI